MQEKLPQRAKGYNQKASIDGNEIIITTREFDDGRIGAFSVKLSKTENITSELLNALSDSVSFGLQHGIPLEDYVDRYTFTRFQPYGQVSGNSAIKNTTSILDYIFRELAVSYLDRYDLAHIDPETESKPRQYFDNIPSLEKEPTESDVLSVEHALRTNSEEIMLLSAMLSATLQNLINDLKHLKPNGEENIQKFDKTINQGKCIISSLNKLTEILKNIDNTTSVDLNKTARSAMVIPSNFSEFINNNQETIDVTIRMTLAAGFAGLFSAAGASMAVATPTILALFGGGKVIEIMKSIKTK